MKNATEIEKWLKENSNDYFLKWKCVWYDADLMLDGLYETIRVTKKNLIRDG
jgi:hypothetical protein